LKWKTLLFAGSFTLWIKLELLKAVEREMAKFEKAHFPRLMKKEDKNRPNNVRHPEAWN